MLDGGLGHIRRLRNMLMIFPSQINQIFPSGLVNFLVVVPTADVIGFGTPRNDADMSACVRELLIFV